MDEFSSNKTSLQKITSSMQKTHARCLQFKKIMVSISGGADSDIMIDLILKVCEKDSLVFVFFDTGIESEATYRHLEYLELHYIIEIKRIKAKCTVPSAVKEYGYPFISKDISSKINSLQNNNFDFKNDGWKSYEELAEKYPRITSVLKWWCNIKEGFNIKQNKWLKEFMIETPPDFKISSRCCNKSKKDPSHVFEKENNIDLKCLGLRKSEGGIRGQNFKNCYVFDSKLKTQNMRPIWWLNDQDKQKYEEICGIVHSDCYLIYGFTRTGCAGCPYNSNFEEDLKIYEKYEPKLFKAVNNIFDKSYEYTIKFREFKKNRENNPNNEVSVKLSKIKRKYE